jgi:RIO-like serine/threonine protein kinase
MDIKIVNYIPQEDINYILYIYETGLLPYELTKIGSGYSAEVFKYKNYAIKAYEDEGFYDGEILEKFQDNDLFPKLYFYNDFFMVTEYLEIVDAYSYFERNVDIQTNALEIYNYCYEKGYVPYDIHDSNVVVTKDDKLKIIDVGSFKTFTNTDLENILTESLLGVRNDYIELDNIIEHVKRPPIAI